LNTYSTVLILTAIVNLALGLYVCRRKGSGYNLEACLLFIAVSFYAFGYAMEINSTELEDIRFWLSFEYTGIAFAPAILTLFTLKYTGNKRYLKPGLILPLLCFSLATLLIQYFNIAKLYYKDFNLVTTPSFTIAAFTKGPWYYVHQTYLFIALSFAAIMFFYKAVKSEGNSRTRSTILFFTVVIPLIFFIIIL